MFRYNHKFQFALEHRLFHSWLYSLQMRQKNDHSQSKPSQDRGLLMSRIGKVYGYFYLHTLIVKYQRENNPRWIFWRNTQQFRNLPNRLVGQVGSNRLVNQLFSRLF